MTEFQKATTKAKLQKLFDTLRPNESVTGSDLDTAISLELLNGMRILGQRFKRIPHTALKMHGSQLICCKFEKCSIEYDFQGALMQKCTLLYSRFQYSNFDWSKFDRCQFVNVDFLNTSLADTFFENCLFSYDVNRRKAFNSSFLSRAVFRNCDFVNVDFDGARLTEAAFYDCTFTHCVFDRAFIHEEPALHPIFLKGGEFYTDTIPRYISEAGIPPECIYDGECNFITVSNCQFAN